MQQGPGKGVVTSGLSLTDFTPQNTNDINCRFLDGYRKSHDFHPRKITHQKAPFEHRRGLQIPWIP